MHRDFKQLLEDATGYSDQIIAIFIDIRGFSAFSRNTDSANVATFVRHVYRKIINEYFPDATFFKSTGDGLLIVVSYKLATDVTACIQACFEKCQKILEEFDNFPADEKRINFSIPNKVGIGISRGSACRLESHEKILDYSGHEVNLAARLMDLARPTGIVFSANVGVENLAKDVQNQFVSEQVYPRGVSPREPLKIFYNPKITHIPRSAKIPFDAHPVEDKREFTLYELQKDIKINASDFTVKLTSKPFDEEKFDLRVEWEDKRSKKTRYLPLQNIKPSYVEMPEAYAVVSIKELAKYISPYVKPKRHLVLIVRYLTLPD